MIGAFTPKMRETDDKAIQRAKVYIDSEEAFHEARDLVQAIESGAFAEERCMANLPKLCLGAKHGRVDESEITLFKAMGTALSDLAAATMTYKYSQT